jgi:hypothetical protein
MTLSKLNARPQQAHTYLVRALDKEGNVLEEQQVTYFVRIRLAKESMRQAHGKSIKRFNVQDVTKQVLEVHPDFQARMNTLLPEIAPVADEQYPPCPTYEQVYEGVEEINVAFEELEYTKFPHICTICGARFSFSCEDVARGFEHSPFAPCGHKWDSIEETLGSDPKPALTEKSPATSDFTYNLDGSGTIHDGKDECYFFRQEANGLYAHYDLSQSPGAPTLYVACPSWDKVAKRGGRGKKQEARAKTMLNSLFHTMEGVLLARGWSLSGQNGQGQSIYCKPENGAKASVTSTPKLSEAIRKGSEMSLEIKQNTLVWGDNPVAACALGAAYLANYGVPGWNPQTKQHEFVSILPDLRSIYPEIHSINTKTIEFLDKGGDYPSGENMTRYIVTVVYRMPIPGFVE